MKKAILVHGWGGSPKSDWFPWMEKELKKRNWKVIVPEMPDTKHPKIKPWIEKLKQVSEEIGLDKNTYFIGHSIGCQAIMRYLEGIDGEIKIGGILFVAAWMNLTNETWDEEYTPEIAEPWINEPLDFKWVKRHSDKFIDIVSDNDPNVALSETEIFRKHLNAEILFLGSKGHITAEDGITEVPIILNKLLEISK